MKYIARFILRLFGWKMRGELPADKKAVVISVPHTSAMDFVWGKLTYMSQGIPTTILIKKEFFFLFLPGPDTEFIISLSSCLILTEIFLPLFLVLGFLFLCCFFVFSLPGILLIRVAFLFCSALTP